MKQSMLTAFAVAFIALLGFHPAFAQPTGWYIGLGGSYRTMR